MKLYQVRIETVGVFLFKKHPTGLSLFADLHNRKVNKDLLHRMFNALDQKGWKNRPIANLISINLGDPWGSININCIPIETVD